MPGCSLTLEIIQGDDILGWKVIPRILSSRVETVKGESAANIWSPCR
jgi:hypothetical protein